MLSRRPENSPSRRSTRARIFVSSLFSIPLMWTHYSHASRCDAKIDTSRIKLANRDLTVLTPEESDWFRSLQFPPFSERGASRKLAGERKDRTKSGEWGVGSGETRRRGDKGT